MKAQNRFTPRLCMHDISKARTHQLCYFRLPHAGFERWQLVLVQNRVFLWGRRYTPHFVSIKHLLISTLSSSLMGCKAQPRTCYSTYSHRQSSKLKQRLRLNHLTHIRLEGLARMLQRMIVFCASKLSHLVFQDALERHLE